MALKTIIVLKPPTPEMEKYGWGAEEKLTRVGWKTNFRPMVINPKFYGRLKAKRVQAVTAQWGKI